MRGSIPERPPGGARTTSARGNKGLSGTAGCGHVPSGVGTLYAAPKKPSRRCGMVLRGARRLWADGTLSFAKTSPAGKWVNCQL